MAGNYTRLTDLLNRYANKSLTQVEENELFDLLNATPEMEVEPLLMNILENIAPMPDAERRERLLAKIGLTGLILNPSPKEKDLERTPVRRIFPWRRWAVAASIILAAGIGTYFLFFNNSGKKNDIVKTNDTVPHDIAAPNVARATLKLDDGTIVYLDSAKNGSLAMQGNINVVKLADGQIAYQGNETGSNEVRYNTIANQRGSKVQALTLSDGTKVWLNAESSITYPTAFVGNERKVTITGEADFVVTHNEKMPFKVIAKGTEIRDVGTEFNINAYEDEANIKVTLLEGSVKVIKGNSEKSLSPGQQAQVTSEVKVVNGVDLEQVMAWKDGMFKFNRTDLKVIMRQIGRWYDAEVSYEGNVPEQLYNGDVSRNVNVSEVLKVLEYTGAHFTVEGKKIVVRP